MGGDGACRHPIPTRACTARRRRRAPPTLDDLAGRLGDREVITIASGYAEVPLGDRRLEVAADRGRPAQPARPTGSSSCRTGDLPAVPGEVVVNDAFAERGVGDRRHPRRARRGRSPSSASVATRPTATRSPSPRLPGSFGPDFTVKARRPDWLVGGDPVTWSRRPGDQPAGRPRPLPRGPARPAAGASRWPSRWATTPAPATTSRSSALIVAMALLEVVLLAGPGLRGRGSTTGAHARADGSLRWHPAPGAAGRARLGSRARSGRCAHRCRRSACSSGWRWCRSSSTFSSAWFGPLDVNWLVVAIVAAFGSAERVPGRRGAGLAGVAAGRRRRTRRTSR